MAIDFSRYEKARRGVNQTHGAQSAAGEFGRFIGNQRSARDQGDYRTNFSRTQDPFMGGMARRGLTGGGIQSGTFQHAMSQRATDFAQGQGRMVEDQANMNRQWDFGQANLDSQRQDALADIQQQEAAEIAAAALQIKALKPLFGG